MVAAAVAGAEEGAPGGGCGILGVTILTSLDAGAAAAGARWLVLGRAVTGAADPVAAMAAVRAALGAAAA
jgi:orotidine-5'-phosphate decarboxylase